MLRIGFRSADLVTRTGHCLVGLCIPGALVNLLRVSSLDPSLPSSSISSGRLQYPRYVLPYIAPWAVLTGWQDEQHGDGMMASGLFMHT